MTLLIFLLLVGLVFGIAGLMSALKWLLIIAVACWLAGALTHYRSSRAP